jgi:putative ABC transport system permease protein
MKIWRSLRALRLRNEELDEEIEGHLRMAVRDRVDRGEDPAEASFAARQEFGNVGLVKEVTREMWALASLEQLVREGRYAIRGLIKAPGFTSVATLTMALGLAAATIIFGVINTVLLRPLPFSTSDRILTVTETIPFFGQKPQVVTLREYLRWRESGVFASAAALDTTSSTLLGVGTPERISGVQVTADFFRIFGLQPIIGRDFRAGEDTPGAAAVVILSHQLWARKFLSDSTVVGKPVRFGDTLRTVIGVLPAGFEFPRHADLAELMPWLPDETEFWVPFQFTQQQVEKGNFNYLVVGRLAQGVSLNPAQARLQSVARQVYEDKANENPQFAAQIRRNIPGIALHLEPLQATMTIGIRSGLWILFGAVVLLLLIIYANLASLFLTRNAGRLREIAIRQALGASSIRIFRERLVESCVFGILAGASGILLAMWGMAVVRAFGGQRVPRLYELTIDQHVLLFLGSLTVAATVLFGAAPWWLQRGFRSDPGHPEHSRTTTRGRADVRLRSALVVAEIALSTVLLIGTGLLLESFRRVLDVKPGFDSDNLLTARVGLPLNKFPNHDQRYRQFERILDEIRRLPGVESASMVNSLPLTGEAETHTLLPAANPNGEAVSLHAEMRITDSEYLRTMRIPLLQGRWFREGEDETSAVVNDSLAKRFWRDRDPLGQQFRDGDNPPMRVVGVAGAVRNATLEVDPTMQFYRPAAAEVYGSMSIVMRTRVTPESMIADVNRAVGEVDPEQPLARIRTMREITDATTLPRRFETWLLTAFGTTALFLSALGIFGVLSLSVAGRAREFGIRMALGASSHKLLRLVLGQASQLVALGILVGLLMALLSGRFLRSLLYGVTASDPRVYV